MGFFEDLAEGLEQTAQDVHDLLDAPRRARVDKARAIAHPLGLRADSRARIGGVLHEVPIRRFSRDHGGKNSTVWYTHTEFELEVPLPGMLFCRKQHAFDDLSTFLGVTEVQRGTAMHAATTSR